MKRGIGCLLFVVLFLSGFVVAGSSSEINLTLFVSDDVVADVDSVVESSASLSFWGMYGDYIVIALVLLVIVLLWLKGKSFSKSKKVIKKRKKKRR